MAQLSYCQILPSIIDTFIDTFTIKQDTQGRYCLNDLHKASGGAEKNKPLNFLRSDQATALVTELQSSETSIDPVQSIRGGSAPGTFVVKELVYAYAMWISASFQLKVIQRRLGTNLMEIEVWGHRFL